MKKEAEERLEPCPFCGGDAYLDSAVLFFNLPKSLRWHAECASCHARTAEKGSREEAVRAWNRRKQGQSGPAEEFRCADFFKSGDTGGRS